MFKENKMSAFTETFMFLVLPFLLYDHMKTTPPNIYGFPLMIFGFVLFLIPKISRIRKGTLISFGCEGMPTKMMVSYFSGIVLLATGFVITFPFG